MAMQCGGIILCGGQSTRMGFPKALLPFGPELMLLRVIRLLGEVVSPLVVVAAPEQEIPPLPRDVQLVRDDREARGPLEGLRAGLAALTGRATHVYATSCDVPLLQTSLVRLLIELAAEDDWSIAVPEAEGFKHPLAAVYSLDVLPKIEALLAADRLRPVFLFEQVPTRVVGEATLRTVDPELFSLRNLNHPADYLAALEMAGFQPPAELPPKLRGEDDASN